MQDQKPVAFNFKITPTNIIISPTSPIPSSLIQQTKPMPSPTPNSSTNKSILIKLGQQQAKCQKLGIDIQINVNVMYSKSLHKYYPIKGILKVYDVAADGNQMILCVGAFNTEELLTDGVKVVNVERDVGACKVLFKIEATNLGNVKVKSGVSLPASLPVVEQKNTNIKSKGTLKAPSEIPIQNKNTPADLKKFPKSPKISDASDFSQNPTPYIIDDSENQDDMDRSRLSDRSQHIKRTEKQMIGQQLLQQRRKTRTLEQKLQKSQIKLQILKKSLAQRNTQIKLFYQNIKNFTGALEFDYKGQYIFQMNEKKRQITLRYKANIKFKEIFQEFISFMVKKLNQGGPLGAYGSEKSIDDENQVNNILSRIQNLDQEKKRKVQENLKLVAEIHSLKNLINQKNIEVIAKDTLLKKKSDQISSLQDSIKRINQDKRGLQSLNQYLQERDSQMQTIISTKQNTIQSLKKMVTDHNTEVDSLQQRNTKLVKIIQNLQLQIQEMKQQNANLVETIQRYRENYGDLKSAKDRALEREFKECLRWIDQQNHQEDLNFQDTVETSENPTVNSIMKSIGEIQNMPLEEISQIRKQVINVLKRLDEFVARNSFVMSP